MSLRKTEKCGYNGQKEEGIKVLKNTGEIITR
jgi:hypothetical protein